MCLQHILYEKLSRPPGPIAQTSIFLMAASLLDTKTNFDLYELKLYGLITLGSMADFCGFWFLHYLQENARARKQGLEPPKPVKPMESYKKKWRTTLG